MTDEEQMQSLAKAFAKKRGNCCIEPYRCPRDVDNAGLWYGFVAGWLAAKAGLAAPEKGKNEPA